VNTLNRRQITIGRLGLTIGIVLFVVWVLLPLSWVLTSSFKERLEIYNSRHFFPIAPSVEAYRQILGLRQFWVSLVNSVYVSLASTSLAVTFCVLAAYGFARYARGWWKHLLLLVVLIPRVVPRISLVVPLYDAVVAAGLLNTYTSLIVTYTATAIPLGTWILIGFFEAVPRELEESAAIDGASIPRILWRIVIPVAWPGIMTIFVLTLREGWNEFPFVMAFTTDMGMRTLPYQLFLLKDSLGIQDWSVISAFTVLSIVPIIVVYLFFQRHVVNSIVSGALK
jgi:ABC-type glycerol-3-phosphate transport system permease component